MLADDMACNARNPFAGEVFNNARRAINLSVPLLSLYSAGLLSYLVSFAAPSLLILCPSYGEDIEVDYRGPEVTVENFIRVLTGKPG